MKSKEDIFQVRPKTPAVILQGKNELTGKPNTQKNTKQYNVQLIILEDIQKLKVNLEITDKNKSKIIYYVTLSLEELISLNPFFKNFEDPSEAFDYLLKNFTKIDRTKILYLNNNKDIKIVLLFSINDITESNGNDVIEEGSIEVILHNYGNTNKTMVSLSSVINNFKTTLEQFNSSIKEIQTNVDNDKIEKDQKIKDLEQSFNIKIDELKKTKNFKNSKNAGNGSNDMLQNYFNEKFIELYSKMEEYENDVMTIKQNMEDEYLKQRNEINKNNKIFIEKENELSQLITDKFEDFINKINSLDEKDVEIENDFNTKLSELDNKTNICFNELIKKINKKSNNENDLKIKLNDVIGKIIEDNENLEKKLESKLNQKIEDLKNEINKDIFNKINILEEKINQLEQNRENKSFRNRNLSDNIYNNNKIIDRLKDLEQKIQKYEKININQNKNNNDEKLNEFNSLIAKKMDDFEKYKNSLLDSFEKSESKINRNKLKIEDLNNQMAGLYEEIYRNKTEEKNETIENDNNQTEINNIKNDINNINKEIKNNINTKINELSDKINKNKNEILDFIERLNTLKQSIDNNLKFNNEKNMQKNNNDKTIVEKSINDLKEEENTIKEFKEEIYSMINKIKDEKTEDNREINTKILNIRSDFLKIFDSRNSSVDNKIKSIEAKYAAYDDKIDKIAKEYQLNIDKFNNTENGNTINNNDNNKLKEIEINIKAYDSRIKNIDSKIKQIEKRIDSKMLRDSYSTKTLLTSNSNKDLIKKGRIHYKMNLTKTFNLDDKENKDKENEESSLKRKRSSYYNLMNHSRSTIKKDKNIVDLNIDTNILKKDDISENFFLFSKLKEIYPYNRYIKLILMYRATKDGDLSKDFHSQCDFIGPNLTLVKTKRGFVFGGFTIKNWKHLYKDIKKDDPDNGTEYKDEKAFCFSVNKRKIYENGFNNENAIFCNNNYGACFKNYFFKIFDKCFKNGGVCGRIDESNFVGMAKDYEFNGGEEKFNVEEIEVFQIGFR